MKNSNLPDEEIAEQIDTRSKIPQRIIENNNTDDHNNNIDGETQGELSKLGYIKHLDNEKQRIFQQSPGASYTWNKILGKRNKRKQFNCEVTSKIVKPLKQRRIEQEIIVKDIFKKHKDQLLAVEDWLMTLKSYKRVDSYDKIGAAICDAIIFPKVPSIFGFENHHTNMKAYLIQHQIPVAVVTDSRLEGCVFIGLDDSKNHFTNDLIKYLKAAVDNLRERVNDIGSDSENIYVRQIDYAQDLLGFFMSLNINDDLKQFVKLVDIPYSTTIKQLATCFQFSKIIQSGNKQTLLQRIKVYNKWVHLLTSGQKKWLSMCLKKILEPSLALYIDKIMQTQDHGFSRIEISDYFHSHNDWIQHCRSIVTYEKKIDKVLKALNSLPQLNYSLSWCTCIESFMKEVDKKKVLVAFQDNLTAIAYCYSKRSCRFGGHTVLKTSKSSSMDVFIKRFGRKHNKVFIGDNYCNVTKENDIMQLPIESMNSKHANTYTLTAPPQFIYYLNNEMLSTIQLSCDNNLFFSIFSSQLHTKVKSMGDSDSLSHINALVDTNSIFDQMIGQKTSVRQYTTRHNIVKNGKKNGKQQWVCKNCKKHYTTDIDSLHSDQSYCV